MNVPITDSMTLAQQEACHKLMKKGQLVKILWVTDYAVTVNVFRKGKFTHITIDKDGHEL